MKLVFFGTPEFAVPSLRKLLTSRHSVVAVVTQPDREAGRGLRKLASPVKREVQAAGSIPVFQPEDLKDPAFHASLKSLSPDLAVVAAFGRLFPRALLELFPKGAINLHASLLPQYRGANPVAWALINGETETGVTIFQMDEKWDHGPILIQAPCPIRPEDDAVTLSRSLAELGSELLLSCLGRMESGSVQPIPQEDTSATEAPSLRKEDGIIDWKLSALEIQNRIRGMQPWPGATTWIEGKLLKIVSVCAELNRHEPSIPPGTVVCASPAEGLWIQTGKGQIRIDRLQPAGGKVLESEAFLRGHRVAKGTRLTGSP